MPVLLIRTIALAPPTETAPHLVWIACFLPTARIRIGTTFCGDLGSRVETA
jgi:hypothetical protein